MLYASLHLPATVSICKTGLYRQFNHTSAACDLLMCLSCVRSGVSQQGVPFASAVALVAVVGLARGLFIFFPFCFAFFVCVVSYK